MHKQVALASLLTFAALASGATQAIETDLLIVGGDESGSAAAVQAARLGVKRIVLVNDIDWLGGQFSVAGIGPVDEWTIVNGKRTNFPRSGAFLEIIERMRAHNRRVYGWLRPAMVGAGPRPLSQRRLPPSSKSGSALIRRKARDRSASCAAGSR